MWGKDGKPKKETISEHDHHTVLAQGVDFKGKAHLAGTVWIDCCFEGDIMSDDILIIGEHAVIKGTIVCGTMISSGCVMGDVTATMNVQLLKPAVLIGNVHSPSLSVEEGVYVHGHIDMGAAPTDVFGVPLQHSEHGEHDLQHLEVIHDVNGDKSGHL